MSKLQRPELTKEQITVGARTGIITEQKRAARKKITTYPIDDHHPDKVADRDDGIYVEALERNGGYRVHVTIADVAAHIPVHSPLGAAPRDRGFTRYLPDLVDSMFPKMAEERMSLENGKERLGIQVSIDLDDHFMPTHTEFNRVITHASAMTYRDAGKLMGSDPQMQLMAKIGDGLDKYYFGESSLALQEFDKKNKEMLNMTEGERKAHATVGRIMMLTNCEVAHAFAASTLPFPYRNFDGTQKNAQGIARASYSTTPTHHEVVKKGDQAREYSHTTSPLRRAPDFWAGHMIHYAIDLMDLLEARLKKNYPHVDTSKLHYALWDHKEAILKSTNKQGDLQLALIECLRQSGITEPVEYDTQSWRVLTREIASFKPPITRKELQANLDRTNALVWKEDLEQAATKRNEKLIARIEETSRGPMEQLNKDEFSQRLADAAETGRLPTSLMDEALHRITVKKDFNRARDAYNVLLVANYPHDERWLKLKREICTAIKHDNSAIRGVFDFAHNSGLLPDNQVFDIETALPSYGDQPKHEQPEVHAAIVLTPSRGDGSLIAPPFYSIGHDPRSALSHARYSYLEHAAFGQLGPVNQITIPNLLYAQLDKHEAPKEEIFERMVEQMGANLQIEERVNKVGKPLCIATVHGGALDESIRKGDVGESFEEAKLKVIRRFLRDDSFKFASRYGETIKLEVVFPKMELEKRCKQADYKLEVQTREVRENKVNSFISTVILRPPYGPEERYSGRASNIKGSVNEACVRALNSHEWLLKYEGPSRSWNTDVKLSSSHESAGIAF